MKCYRCLRGIFCQLLVLGLTFSSINFASPAPAEAQRTRGIIGGVKEVRKAIRNNRQNDQREAEARLNELKAKSRELDEKRSELERKERELAESDDPEQKEAIEAAIRVLKEEIRGIKKDIETMLDKWGRKGREEVTKLIDSMLNQVIIKIANAITAYNACVRANGADSQECIRLKEELDKLKEDKAELERLKEIVRSRGAVLSCGNAGFDSEGGSYAVMSSTSQENDDDQCTDSAPTLLELLVQDALSAPAGLAVQ